MNKAKRLEVVRHMGKQIAAHETVTCPLCSIDMPDEDGQPMMATGDYEEVLFCPHCDLAVELTFSDGGMWRKLL